MRSARGQSSGDPFRRLIEGSRFEIRSRLYPITPSSTCCRIENWEYFEGSIVAFHFFERESLDFDDVGRHSILGTGIFVAPGIVVTAKHVLDDCVSRLESGLTRLVISTVLGENLQLWKPVSSVLVSNSDLAIVCVQLDNNYTNNWTFNVVTPSTRTPRIGEQVTIVGFRFEQSDVDFENMEISSSGGLWISSGIVTEVYDDKRDSRVLPWPVFEVQCDTLRGMSGGPVFDRQGFLIGVLTSGFETSDASGPSYASLLWRALIAEFSPTWPAGLYDGSMNLLDLHKKGCTIEKPEAVEIRSSDGIAVYYSWSDR